MIKLSDEEQKKKLLKLIKKLRNYANLYNRPGGFCVDIGIKDIRLLGELYKLLESKEL